MQPGTAENTGGFVEADMAKPEPTIMHEKADLSIFNQQFNDKASPPLYDKAKLN